MDPVPIRSVLPTVRGATGRRFIQGATGSPIALPAPQRLLEIAEAGKGFSQLKETVLATRTITKYAEYVCTNSICEEGEFASRVPPLYVELPSCPCCGCPSILYEVLYREAEM